MDPALVEMCELPRGVSAIDYDRASYRRTELWHVARTFFHRFDLLVTPTLPRLPYAASEGTPRHEQDLIRFTIPFSFAGTPAMSLPIGWTDDGLPIGVQLVAPAFHEARLFTIAAELEMTHPWRHRYSRLLVAGNERPGQQ